MNLPDVNDTFMITFSVLDANMGAGKTHNVANFVRGPKEGPEDLNKSVIAPVQRSVSCDMGVM
jgi:hypothetical protein